MLGKQVFSGFIAGLFLLTLFGGQVFASGIGTEAGVDVQPSQRALSAAADYDYSDRHLAGVGTEAGVDVMPSETAIDSGYELDPLHAEFIGTEGGLDVWRAGGTCPAVQELQC